MPDHKRLVVYFSGTVQGVGFRFTAMRVARRFPVTGYVRNLRDGRVELVAEGEPETLTRFLAGVEQAMSGYISNRQATFEPAAGEFDEFRMAY